MSEYDDGYNQGSEDTAEEITGKLLVDIDSRITEFNCQLRIISGKVQLLEKLRQSVGEDRV